MATTAPAARSDPQTCLNLATTANVPTTLWDAILQKGFDTCAKFNFALRSEADVERLVGDVLFGDQPVAVEEDINPGNLLASLTLGSVRQLWSDAHDICVAHQQAIAAQAAAAMAPPPPPAQFQPAAAPIVAGGIAPMAVGNAIWTSVLNWMSAPPQRLTDEMKRHHERAVSFQLCCRNAQ